MKVGVKACISTPIHRAPHLYHVSTCDNLSFGPATPRTHSSQEPGTPTTVHHHLTLEENDDSSLNNNTLLENIKLNILLKHSKFWQKREFPLVGYKPDASRLPDEHPNH